MSHHFSQDKVVKKLRKSEIIVCKAFSGSGITQEPETQLLPSKSSLTINSWKKFRELVIENWKNLDSDRLLTYQIFL